MPLPTGTVTFLFSDIEGSTARWEAHHDAMEEALHRHNAVVRAAIESHNGHVFKTVGDEFCAVFSRTPDAVAAAAGVQRALDAEDWSAVNGLRVRMGVHAGITQERDGDYFGPNVNHVARLMSAGHGGQVLISQTAAEIVGSDLPERAMLRDLGTHRLKDLPTAEIVYQLVAPGLRDEFPPLRTVDSNPTNIPVQLTPILGRDEEIAEIESLLAQSRLVTLVGSGGVGKTRTALETATRNLTKFPDGTWFVDLAPLSDPELVGGAIAQTVHVEPSGSRPIVEDVAHALQRKRTLILLDNCEHLVGTVAAAAETLLHRCPELRILATSREALAIEGERWYRMPSLPEAAAIELFVERARAARPQFTLTEATAPVVADIVRRLDGIAFAIELAASRVKIMNPERIAKGLDARFELLTSGSRTALPRRQTLRALIGWSYDLLSDAERSMLNRLAVFRGGWTLEAAEDICVDERFRDWDAATLLESLADKSLVIADVENERFHMLESTREYARERLIESGDVDPVASRHCAFYAGLAQRAGRVYWEIDLAEFGEREALEAGNLGAAIDWGLTLKRDIDSALQLVASTSKWPFPMPPGLLVQALDSVTDATPPLLRARVYFARGRFALDRGGTDEVDAARDALSIFECDGEPEELIEAKMFCGTALFRRGLTKEAIALGEEALAAARALGRTRFVAVVAARLGQWTVVTGDAERGRTLQREAIALLRDAGDRRRLAGPLEGLAEALFAEGAIEEAIAYANESLEICRESGTATTAMVLDLNIAAYSLAIGRTAEAREHALAALDEANLRGSMFLVAVAVGHVAHIAALEGAYETAARLVAFVDAAYARLGFVREITEQRGHEATLEILAGNLGDERRAELAAEGSDLDQGAAIREARSVTVSPNIAPGMDASAG